VEENYMEKFKLHFEAQRCYARARGYEFWLLDIRSWPACQKYTSWGASMFFSKHCVVRSFLEQQELGYAAVVIDADVVPAVLGRGIERWLLTDVDIHFYQRLTVSEIAAGNYLVRNTPWALNFLYEWAEFAFKVPKGYSSYDNGALHVHLVQTLQLHGGEVCEKMYNELDVDMRAWLAQGQNETTYFDTYFAFLRFAMQALGPSRTWRTASGGGLTIWPRGQFFVVDGIYFMKEASLAWGPVLHHGIKDSRNLSWYFSSVERCEPHPQVLQDPVEFGAMVLPHFHQYNKTLFNGEMCFQCTDDCISKFSCEPLAPDAEPRPQFSLHPAAKPTGSGQSGSQGFMHDPIQKAGRSQMV